MFNHKVINNNNKENPNSKTKFCYLNASIVSGPGVNFNHVYQSQVQQQFVPSFISHSGHSGNIFHLMPHPHVSPSVYFSNYTNVNVHGYPQTMQQYLPNAFVPTDNHQNSIEQVMCFTIVFFF